MADRKPLVIKNGAVQQLQAGDELDVNLTDLVDVNAPAPVHTDALQWDSGSAQWEPRQTHHAFYNGTFREKFDALVTSDGATITLTLQQSPTGDLTMQFTNEDQVLDCTSPAQTIILTAGADDAPQPNYIYIPVSTKVVTKSIAGWPSEEHIKIAYCLVPSATFVKDYGGCYINQNWNDHLEGTNNQGHMSHVAMKIRRLGATWFSGVSANGATASYFTIAAGSTLWKSTTGVISQMHEHTYIAKDMSGGSGAIVVNDDTLAYTHVTNLFLITEDNTGTTISNNRYFNLVFWGVANKTGEFSGLMVNLPGGFYTLSADANVDSKGHDVYDIPREFNIDSGTAFLICRATFKMGATWSHVSTVDLRGLTPATASGSSVNDHGGLGGLTDVADHPGYLLADGTRNLTGNMAVDALITIDGRDLSVDGGKLDGIESGADVTDATNVAAAGAAMSGGAFHDGFSDFVTEEHIDWTSTSSNLSTTGTVSTIEVFNSAGDLKIMPDVQGDVQLFGDTDIGDDDDGKRLYIHRKAVEGDIFIELYVTANKTGRIHSTNFEFFSDSYMAFDAVGDFYFDLADSAGVRSVIFRDSGYNPVASIDSDGNASFDGTISGINVTSGVDPGHTHSGMADEKVGIDSGATPDYIGAAANDGCLRLAAGLKQTDGGDYITIKVDVNGLSTSTINASDTVPFHSILNGETRKITYANFEATLNHDNLFGKVANEHIDHSGILISGGTGLSGGGAITANRTLALSHLGLESLADPGADRILFWDDSEGALKWLTVGNYLTLSGADLTSFPGYVARGDEAGWDITEASLTLDNTWRDLSLTGYDVPAGAYAVQVRVFFKGTAIGQYAGIRPNGNSNEMQAISQYTQSTSTMEMQGVILCDADRIIEYNGVSALTIFRVLVKGWFI